MTRHKPQPGVRDSEGRKIPKKYLHGLSKKKRGEMKKEIKDFRDKPDDYSPAYEPWTADRGVQPKKKSKATKAYHRMFGKKHESARNDSLFGRVFLEADNEDPHAHLKADSQFKPPSGPSDRYYSATRLQRVHRDTYFRKGADDRPEKIASSRTTRSNYPLDIPLGSWQIDDGHKGSHGRDVEELRAYHTHELVPSIGEVHQWPPPAGKNPKEMLRERARHPDVERYADWVEKDHNEREARGETHTHARIKPLVVVKHFDKGDLRLTAGGGHRRLAAVALVNQRRAKQGKPPLKIPAWTGWDTAHPEGIKDWQGRPMRAGLTHELSQGQPVDRSYKKHEPEQSSKESVQEDEARNGKWDITHKDLSGGRMLLIKHSTGERRTLPRTQAALMRSRIAKIEDMWGEEAGPEHLYPNHHKHIDAVLEPFFEDVMLHESSEKGLAAKAEASGIPLSILRQVFKRGMAAWKTGHRPGVAQQQWAYGRVNSFITGSGGARKADADLWAKAKKARKQEEAMDLSRTPLLAEHVCDTKKSGKPWRTPGGPKKFAVCADGKLVRFGDPNLEIKRDSAKRRKNFRARHNCAEPGPRTKAKYWACRTWERGKTVSDIVN